MTDHVFGHQDGDKLLPVMHTKRQTDELGQDGRTPRPDLDHLLGAGSAGSICLFKQITVNKLTFPNLTSHSLIPISSSSRDGANG